LSFFSFLAFFEDSSPIAEAEHGATSAADVRPKSTAMPNAFSTS
jgi:hypothetical protein